jgi:membrane protein insertase Oxa1/YidC/SpoIIIJ
LLLSGKKKANCTVVDIAAGSSRVTFTSSAITVSSTGSPAWVMAEISSRAFTNFISPEKESKKKLMSLFPLAAAFFFLSFSLALVMNFLSDRYLFDFLILFIDQIIF